MQKAAVAHKKEQVYDLLFYVGKICFWRIG